VAAVIMRHPRESVAITVGSLAVMSIFINALFLQPGPHPAPIFAPKHWGSPVIGNVVPAKPEQAVPMVPAVPAVTAPARSRAEIITDIQRELSRRGFYQGAVDGLWGGQTDAALHDFAQASGAKMTFDANEDVLRAISASKTFKKSGATPVPAPRQDPIAELLAPTARVLAVQRALSDFGYGQIKPTGVVGPDTADAIGKFERSHGMPVTGQLSTQLVNALSSMTGRPIE
jgi:peptidoglycan hydrolase-like protein with peptidoglycan-binding domain